MGNADLDEVAPTFQELLADTDVSFVQACASGVDLERKEVHLAGSIADDLDGYVVSDKADESKLTPRSTGTICRNQAHLNMFMMIPRCEKFRQ